MNNNNDAKIYKIKSHLSEVKNKVENITQIYNRKIKYFINLINQFNDLAKNHYLNISPISDKEPEIINQNRLLHGAFSREVSQRDCLQLFCVISNMAVLKVLIDASDEISLLKQEIDKGEKEISSLKKSNL